MSKKFSITTINFNKLNDELDKYMQLNNCKPYLFMCKNTINAILNEYPVVEDALHNYNQVRAKVNGIAAYYRGHKVFEDNTLKFGDIEIK